MIEFSDVLVPAITGITCSAATVATLRRDIHWLRKITDAYQIETTSKLRHVENRVRDLELEKVKNK